MRIQKTRNWLAQHTLPHWLKNGVDYENGGFFESLTFEGKPLAIAKRGMVQARQIYSLRLAQELGLCDLDSSVLERAIDFWIKNFAQANGSFIHAVQPSGKAHHLNPDLYNQAFSLFGLAQAFIFKPEPRMKEHARALIGYLNRDRRTTKGGFTEIQDGKLLFEANPHMHLFEAAVTWMEIDPDPIWRSLAEEILDLCLLKFIDSSTGLLAEHFDENWVPLKDPHAFIFEPGHHYEWAWLMGRYQKLTQRQLLPVRMRLFETAEKYGVSDHRKAAYDEVWSDLQVKKKSTRFWPQTERIKIALQLGADSPVDDKARFAKVADEALDCLFEFLDAPVPGLWYDCRSESGELLPQAVKASSLYHIIGAMAEYLRIRASLQSA
jgi:mannose/cellobiose epimerase-like protein (N-acyl-D-glucosamine 2-epimerase family)